MRLFRGTELDTEVTSVPTRFAQSLTGETTGGGNQDGEPRRPRAEDLLHASKAAEEASPTSTFVKGKFKDWSEYWDVTVLLPDGATNKYKVSADGSKVVRGPKVKGPAGPKSEVLLQQLSVVELTVDNAILRAQERYPNSSVMEAKIGRSRGRVVWKVELFDDRAGLREVYIDVVTGELVKEQIGG